MIAVGNRSVQHDVAPCRSLQQIHMRISPPLLTWVCPASYTSSTRWVAILQQAVYSPQVFCRMLRLVHPWPLCGAPRDSWHCTPSVTPDSSGHCATISFETLDAGCCSETLDADLLSADFVCCCAHSGTSQTG